MAIYYDPQSLPPDILSLLHIKPPKCFLQQEELFCLFLLRNLFIHNHDEEYETHRFENKEE